MNQQKKQAFTLVELVIVVIILAILGTIAFISLQWYSKDARDATRISDISVMKSSLELFYLDAGKYPFSTDSFTVTYSWSNVWNQGTYGESVFTNTDKLDAIPTDPLTEKYYTYSVTTTRQEYQIAWMMESDFVSFFPQSYAWDVEATALVSGNYNGAVLKTLTGTTCEMLSLPSIVSNQPETTTNLVDILSSEWLVYHWFRNLPSNLRKTKYKADGWFAFTSQKFVVYTDDDSCSTLSESTQSGAIARLDMVSNLQNAYSGTVLENIWAPSRFVNVDKNDGDAISQLWTTLINNSFGWNLEIDKQIAVTYWCDESTRPADNGHIVFSVWNPTLPNVAYTKGATDCWYTCTDGYDGLNCVTAPTECVDGMDDITLSNGQTWSCKNLWATTVWDWVSHIGACVPTWEDCTAGVPYMWNKYQWWINTPWYVPYRWSTDPNVWIGNPWPCPSWRHVPSRAEWQSACSTITWSSCTTTLLTDPLLIDTLKLPTPWRVIWTTSISYSWVWSQGYYWTNTYLNSLSRAVFYFFLGSNMYPTWNSGQDWAYSIRCIKD